MFELHESEKQNIIMLHFNNGVHCKGLQTNNHGILCNHT